MSGVMQSDEQSSVSPDVSPSERPHLLSLYCDAAEVTSGPFTTHVILAQTTRDGASTPVVHLLIPTAFAHVLATALGEAATAHRVVPG